MAWRRARADFERGKGDGNRRALKRRVESGAPLGVLAIAQGRAVGWCSTGPRADFAALERMRSLATDWDERTWSVTCFLVDKAWRRRGLGQRLLDGAVRLAGRNGAACIEGYPAAIPKGGEDLPAVFAWTGLPKVFERCSFELMEKTPGKRPIYRRSLARRKRS